MLSEWQTHKGKMFLFCNFAGLETTDTLRAAIKESDLLIMTQPLNSVLVLVDVHGVPLFSKSAVSLVIDTIPRGKKYVRKTAVLGVGLTGQRKVLFESILQITGGDMMAFDDMQQAKDWLVSG